jgi:death-on-curing protein
VNEVEYLDLEDMFALVRILRVGPVRDPGLLESSCARPRATVFGVDAYETVHQKAAALLHSLALNHPLADGNKRLAWLATVVFLTINRQVVALHGQAAIDLVVEVAAGRVEVEEIARRLAEA